MKTLADRYQFFKEHAGYIVGQAAVCAMRLARAEERAEKLGLEVVWEDENESWESINGPDSPAPNVHAQAYVPDPEGSKVPLAALGSIALDSWRDPYMHVIEAELYVEALAEIDAANERAWTREACELAARATFAAGGVS